MKHSTRKYAKRQVSWIKNKLLPAIFATAQDVMPAHDPDGVEANGPESVAQMRAYLLDANGAPNISFTVLVPTSDRSLRSSLIIPDVGEKWTTAVLDTASNIVYGMSEATSSSALFEPLIMGTNPLPAGQLSSNKITMLCPIRPHSQMPPALC